MSVLERVKSCATMQEDTSMPTYVSSAQDTSLSVHYMREAQKRLQDALIERLGLSTISSMMQNFDTARFKDELKISAQDILHTDEFSDVLASDYDALIQSTTDIICGYGPIQQLLDDVQVTEIMINGTDSLFYEKDGRLYQAEQVFENAEQIMMVVDRILAPLGRRLDRSSPIVNARLANGDRVNAVYSNVAIHGPSVTIRKFSNRITSMDELVRLGSLPAWFAQLLSWAVWARQDIAVAGGTGSGKTTLLNALSCEIRKTERIVTIEDSAELKFTTHPDVVRLEAQDASIEGSGEITIRDLVKNALRMRPDRIVVGECRGSETIDMLQAMNTGHDGSLTTLHAGTAPEAILRLVLMARFGMDLPTDIIEEQIASALDLLVMSQRMSNGSRRVTTLSEVQRGAKGGVELRECVSFDEHQNAWRLVHEPAFLQVMCEGYPEMQKEVVTWRLQVS